MTIEEGEELKPERLAPDFDGKRDEISLDDEDSPVPSEQRSANENLIWETLSANWNGDTSKPATRTSLKEKMEEDPIFTPLITPETISYDQNVEFTPITSPIMNPYQRSKSVPSEAQLPVSALTRSVSIKRKSTNLSDPMSKVDLNDRLKRSSLEYNSYPEIYSQTAEYSYALPLYFNSSGMPVYERNPVPITPATYISAEKKRVSLKQDDVEKLSNASNYEAIRDGKGDVFGISDDSSLVLGMEHRRSSHKAAEQKRRDCIKQLFTELKSVVPLQSDKQHSRMYILQKTRDYIVELYNQNVSMGKQLEVLKQEVANLKGKLSESDSTC